MLDINVPPPPQGRHGVDSITVSFQGDDGSQHMKMVLETWTDTRTRGRTVTLTEELRAGGAPRPEVAWRT